MAQHNLTVADRRITYPHNDRTVQNNVEEDTLVVTWDEEWNNLTSLLAIFTNGKTSVSKAVSTSAKTNPITVPWEVLADEGFMSVCFVGYKSGNGRIVTEFMERPFMVAKSGHIQGLSPKPATRDAFEEMLDELSSAIGNASSAATGANNAASAANTAISSANTAANDAQIAAGNAATAASVASEAATNAENAAKLANDAVSEVEDAVQATKEAVAKVDESLEQFTTITGSKIEYQVSKDPQIPTGEWSEDLPTVQQGQYLWVRTTLTDNHDQKTVSYSLAFQGRDGSFSGDEQIKEIKEQLGEINDLTTGVNLLRGTRDFVIGDTKNQKNTAFNTNGFSSNPDATYSVDSDGFTKVYAKAVGGRTQYTSTYDGELEPGSFVTFTFDYMIDAQISVNTYIAGISFYNGSSQIADSRKILYLTDTVEPGKWHQGSVLLQVPDSYDPETCFVVCRVNFPVNFGISFKKCSLYTDKINHPIWSANPFDNNAKVNFSLNAKSEKIEVGNNYVTHKTYTDDSNNGFFFRYTKPSSSNPKGVEVGTVTNDTDAVSYSIADKEDILSSINDLTTGINLMRGTRDIVIGSGADKFGYYENGFRLDANRQTIVKGNNGFGILQSSLSSSSQELSFAYSPKIRGFEAGDTLTISFFAKYNVAATRYNNLVRVFLYDSSSTSLDSGNVKTLNIPGREIFDDSATEDSWTLHSVKFEIPNSINTKDENVFLGILFYTSFGDSTGRYSYTQPMVQRGNINHPIWSDNPSDVAQQKQVDTLQNALDTSRYIPIESMGAGNVFTYIEMCRIKNSSGSSSIGLSLLASQLNDSGSATGGIYVLDIGVATSNASISMVASSLGTLYNQVNFWNYKDSEGWYHIGYTTHHWPHNPTVDVIGKFPSSTNDIVFEFVNHGATKPSESLATVKPTDIAQSYNPGSSLTFQNFAAGYVSANNMAAFSFYLPHLITASSAKISGFIAIYQDGDEFLRNQSGEITISRVRISNNSLSFYVPINPGSKLHAPVSVDFDGTITFE